MIQTQVQIPSWLNDFFTEEFRNYWLKFGIQFGLFVLGIFFSFIAGRILLSFFKSLIHKLFPETVYTIYDNLTGTVTKSLRVTFTLLLFYIALDFIKDYGGLYRYLKLGVDFAISFSFAFLCSGLFRNFLRIYGVNLIRKVGVEIDELLSIIEAFVNVLIGIFAALTFAQSQNINLVGILAGLGIGGLAVAFAAQNTLGQLVGTIVIYLDRPYSVGEYIRVSLSSQGVLLGKVESIGIRSTKLRTLAKSTLVIVPNSTMANADIENVTRGKKIMALLYFDFSHTLDKTQQAILEKTVREYTNTLFGIDTNSINVKISPKEKGKGVRAQVSLFVLGSRDNSQEFRRQLLVLVNDSISKELLNYGLEFTLKEPTVYVESSVTI